MKNLLFWFVLLILIFANYGTYGLVIEEYAIGNICPKILNIPACYIVLGFFAGALISHLYPSKISTRFYFIFIGSVCIIAVTGTLGEIFGFASCPKTHSGIPMCFISLAICILLIVFKLLHIKR